MANRFTQKAQNTLNRALMYARELGHTYIGSEHILLGLLGEREGVGAKLLEARGVTLESVRDVIIRVSGVGIPSVVTPSDMTPRVKKIIELASYESLKNKQTYIGTEHILLALLEEKECTAHKILAGMGLSLSDLKNDALQFMQTAIEKHAQPSRKSKSHDENKAEIAGAPTLSQYGRNLTQMAKEGKLDPVIGREKETDRVIQILSRRQKNNPCLIGEPGVGKTAVVEGLAQRMAEDNVPDILKERLIVTLDIPGMIAGAKYRGEFEERMKSVMREVAKNPDIILFIDEIHTIIGAGAAEGAVDAANILKPALARGELQMIGATTVAEYRKHIEKDAALERRFQSVSVGEPSPEDAKRILLGLRDKYEAHHRLKISDEAIDCAVDLSRRYITDRYLPDKAIDLIDEAASYLRINAHTPPPDLKAMEEKLSAIGREKAEAIEAQDFERAAAIRDEEKALKSEWDEAKNKWDLGNHSGDIVVGGDDIAAVVTQWTQIPVNRLMEGESEKLLRAEEFLRARVVGQDQAVEAVAKAIRRGRLGLKDPGRPIGSFIFLGPTGVGKTELSKALAELLFGDPGAMIRLDMSEYMEKHSVSKLIGSPPGYVGFEEGGQLSEKIRRRPYAVILFDEMEKAHPDVFNILLQMLEDGILTDSQGRTVDCKNAILIMTSNLGASYGKESKTLGFSAESREEADKRADETRIMNALKETFSPEFLNRIDDIVIFNRLGRQDIETITRLMLADLRERVVALGMDLELGDDVVSFIAGAGFDPLYGARPLRRAIVRLLEDEFSSRMLEGAFQAGDTVIARIEGDRIVLGVMAQKK